LIDREIRPLITAAITAATTPPSTICGQTSTTTDPLGLAPGSIGREGCRSPLTLNLARSNEPRLAERIDVYSLNAIGLRLYKAHIGAATIAARQVVNDLILEAAKAVDGHKFGQHFLLTEWEQVVDAWQLADWEVDPSRDAVPTPSPARPQAV
jgi:hypothetical protein